MNLRASPFHARVCRIYEALIAPALGAPRLALVRDDGVLTPAGSSWGLVDARAYVSDSGASTSALDIVLIGPGDEVFEDISVSVAVRGGQPCGRYALCLTLDGSLVLWPQRGSGAWYGLGRRDLHRLFGDPLSDEEAFDGAARAGAIIRQALMKAA